MKQTIKGTFFSITAGILLGLSPLLAKTLNAAGSTAFTLAVARMVFGTAFFAILHRATGHTSFRIPLKTGRKLLLCAAGFSTSPIFAYLSYNYMNSGLATTIQFLYPAVILAGSVAFYRRKISALQILCCGLCLVGVFCFSGGGVVSSKGILLALCCACCYGFYSLFLGESGLLELPLSLLSFWLCCFASIFSAIATLLFGQFALPTGGRGWLVLLIYVLAMAVSAITYQVGVQCIGVAKASMLSAFEPMTSMIIGIFVYKEVLTLQILVGFVCILIAVILLNRIPSPTRNATKKERSGPIYVSDLDS